MSIRRWPAVILALGLVATACGGGSGSRADNGSDGAAEPTASTPSASDAPHVDPVERLGAEFADGADTSPTAKADTSKNRFGAPSPGRYRLRLGSDSDGPIVVLDVFDRKAKDQPADGLAQAWVRRTHDEGMLRLVVFDGRGMVVTDEVRYRSDGSTRPCTWEPAYVEVPRTLRSGLTWSVDSRCESGSTSKLEVRRKISAEVIGEREVDLFDRRFSTVEIAWEATDSIVGNGLDAGDKKALTIDWSWRFGLALQTQGGVGTVIAGEVKNAGGSWERILTDPAKPESSAKPADLHG
ncbi:MAG: hypothetical protein ACR2H3_03015 [Acidimicrobiales bacterium]